MQNAAKTSSVTKPGWRTATAAYDRPYSDEATRCTEVVLNAFGIHGVVPTSGGGVLEALVKNGWQYRPVWRDEELQAKTVASFVATHPTGRWYITTAGGSHSMAVVDGVLWDFEDRGEDRRRIAAVYEVYPQTTAKAAATVQLPMDVSEGDTLYRGFVVNDMPTEVWWILKNDGGEQVDVQSLLGHIRSGELGPHWSADTTVAENFASGQAQFFEPDDNDAYAPIGFVVAATGWTERDLMDEGDANMGGYLGQGASEQEVPLKPGTHLNVVYIGYTLDGDEWGEIPARGLQVQAKLAAMHTLYYGTTKNAWVALKNGGRKLSPRDVCGAIEHQFALPSGSVWNHPTNAWSRSRNEQGNSGYLYTTTDRRIAEGYAQAGGAPVFDAYRAAYQLLHPEKRKPDVFGPKYEGIDEWIKEQVIAFGGGPVLVTLSVPWDALQTSFEWLIQSKMRTHAMDEAEFAAWLEGRGEVNDREVSFAAPVEIVRYATNVTDLPIAEGRIITRNGALVIKDYEAETGNKGHISRNEQGTVPTAWIADLKGVMGEQPGQHGASERQGEAWQKFLDDIRTNGIREPIFITEDFGGSPQISEGNTRRDAAVELGLKEVPVEVRYFGHAERIWTLEEWYERHHTAKLGAYEDQRERQALEVIDANGFAYAAQRTIPGAKEIDYTVAQRLVAKGICETIEESPGEWIVRRVQQHEAKLATKTIRFYHGTTQQALDAIRTHGFKPPSPIEVAHAVEEHCGLPRDTVVNSDRFDFSRGRTGDPSMYVTTDYDSARFYAGERSEVVADALGAAWWEMYGNPDLTWKEVKEPRDRWVAEQSVHFGDPVVLTLDLPISVVRAEIYPYAVGDITDEDIINFSSHGANGSLDRFDSTWITNVKTAASLTFAEWMDNPSSPWLKPPRIPKLYHGTSTQFSPGDRVSSPAERETIGQSQGTALTGVFASDSLSLVGSFAQAPDAHVYEVRPVDPDDVWVNRASHGGAGDEYATEKGYIVVREIEPPGGTWAKKFLESDAEWRTRMFSVDKTAVGDRARGAERAAGPVIMLKGLARKAQESGTLDAFKTIHDVARGYDEPGSVADSLDLDTVTDNQITMASKQIAAASQEALRRDGYPEQFEVFRLARPGERGGVVSVSIRPLETFANPQSYTVDRGRVLTYGEALQRGNFAEAELQVDAGDLRRTAKVALLTSTVDGPLYHGTTVEAAEEILREGWHVGGKGEIWLTPSRELAGRYAEGAVKRVEIAGGTAVPAILSVEGVRGVSAMEVGYLDLNMARDAGADYSPQGEHIIVLNPSAIVGGVRKVAAAGEFYRGGGLRVHDKAKLAQMRAAWESQDLSTLARLVLSELHSKYGNEVGQWWGDVWAANFYAWSTNLEDWAGEIGIIYVSRLEGVEHGTVGPQWKSGQPVKIDRLEMVVPNDTSYAPGVAPRQTVTLPVGSLTMTSAGSLMQTAKARPRTAVKLVRPTMHLQPGQKFHLAPREARDAIDREGLHAGGGVYFWDNIDSVDAYRAFWSGRDFDLYIVEVPDSALRPDPLDVEGAFVTNETIPPERVARVSASAPKTGAVEPRPGMRFLHARQLQEVRGVPVKEWPPEECEVTRVAQGTVYYRNSTGFLTKTPIEQFSSIVKEVLGLKTAAGERLPDGVSYDPHLPNEARNERALGKGIKVGPKFFERTEQEQRYILAHEDGHDLADAMFRDGSAWELANLPTPSGPVHDIQEDISDLYADLIIDPQDAQRWPEAAELVARKAKEHGFKTASAGPGPGRTDSAKQDKISDEVVEDLMRKGGFSVTTHGSVPRSGWMVSIPGHEKVLGSMSQVTPTAIEKYMDANRSALDPEERYLGGWVDTTDDKVYLDVSEHFASRAQAVAEGKRNKQLAVFNVESGNELRLDKAAARKLIRFFVHTDETPESIHRFIKGHQKVGSIPGEIKNRTLYRAVPVPMVNPTWDAAAANVVDHSATATVEELIAAAMEDYGGVGIWWGDDSMATGYSNDDMMVMGVQFPQSVLDAAGNKDINSSNDSDGWVLTRGDTGMLVSLRVNRGGRWQDLPVSGDIRVVASYHFGAVLPSIMHIEGPNESGKFKLTFNNLRTIWVTREEAEAASTDPEAAEKILQRAAAKTASAPRKGWKLAVAPSRQPA